MATASKSPKRLVTAGFLEDPYPTYRRFLNEGSLHYLDFLGKNVWTLFGYADCSTVIRDERLSARRAGAYLKALDPAEREQFSELARLLTMWMLFLDAPEHSRLRKLMNKGFSPSAVESLRPQVESTLDRLLRPLGHASQADLLKEIAYPLPVRVIAEMLGISEEFHDRLVESTDAIAVFFGTPSRTVEDVRAAEAGVRQLMQFFREVVAQRRKHRGQDLISLLLDIEEGGEVLTEEELHAQCVMLLFGGHETTRNLIGNGMYTLLRHREAMAELRENPQLVRSAVEELLRYESPVQLLNRVVKEEMEILGVRFERGQSVLFLNAAANRDPAQFVDADRLDLKRLHNPHLAFGAGAHFCIGNQLARLEGQVALLKLTQRFPRMRLAEQSVEWVPNFTLRGLKALPVVL